ncbi:MAG: hypothetical protein HYU59_05815 [Magnetospirillum gryphiswaldense]|nr:hypothetical protein [Magnetospirillum gryphiswaldense]
MRLVDDWLSVLRKAWSIRLIALAALLSGLEIAIPLLDGVVDLPRGLFAALSGVVTSAALVARLVAQRSMNDADARD